MLRRRTGECVRAIKSQEICVFKARMYCFASSFVHASPHQPRDRLTDSLTARQQRRAQTQPSGSLTTSARHARRRIGKIVGRIQNHASTRFSCPTLNDVFHILNFTHHCTPGTLDDSYAVQEPAHKNRPHHFQIRQNNNTTSLVRFCRKCQLRQTSEFSFAALYLRAS